MAHKIAVIGKGTIGDHIIQSAKRYNLDVAVIVGRTQIQIPWNASVTDLSLDFTAEQRAAVIAKCCQDLRVRFAMIAIPSGGDGQAELCIIKALLDCDIKVVTAGKSALANRFGELEDRIRHIGFDASCGGGAMIPSFVSDHLYVHKDHPFVLTAVLNGTLNYAQTRARDGVSAEQICNEALRLGFAEPPEAGNLTPLDMYRGELSDISRKIAILCNTRLKQLVGTVISQHDLEPGEFTESDRAYVMAGNSNYRYLVRICSREEDVEYFNDITIGGKIIQRFADLSIAAGFVELKGSLEDWVPNHVGNAVHLVQNGDTDVKIGQGAVRFPLSVR